MKNLLMIHLESLNYDLFMRFPEIFKEIHALKNKGRFYNHFFSTATSTLMVIGDIVYGGKEQYEACTSLDDIPAEYYYSNSMFDDLKQRGYNTGLFVYPDGGDRESAEKRHIAGFQHQMLLKTDYNEFLRAIDGLIIDEPFAIMACNYISNVTINRYTDLEDLCDGSEKWLRGYRYLDRFVGDIIRLLEQKNKLNDTVVLLYGDHGDDFWGHGLHGGLTHAVEPYASLIHTPFIVVSPDLPDGLDETLLCATDLRMMVNTLLDEKSNVIVSNNYIIARSSYAAQPIRVETFNKAYSITDGKFLMLVSAKGLELYDIEMDFQCTFNYFELYKLDHGIIRYDIDKTSELRFHYEDFMNEAEIRNIRQIAYYLKSRLYKEVLSLYRIAGRTEENMNQEIKFYKIHYKNR